MQRVGAFKCAFSHTVPFVCFFVSLNAAVSLVVPVLAFLTIDHHSFLRDLHLIDWSGVFSCLSVTDKFDTLLFAPPLLLTLFNV